MRVLRLPRIAQLGDRARFAERDEDRVEAEAFGPRRLVRDRPVEHARAAQLATLRRERDELADVARPPVLAVDRGERLRDVVARSTSGR